MSTWASYPYCFDIPQAVETQMKLPPYNLSSSEFNYLYVCISIPNIVLSFIAAIITTKIGPIRAICLYVVMLMVGQGIITWAAYSAEGGWYWFMLIGRVLMGTSGYSLVGANLALIPKYTEAKYVSLFIGLGSMFPWTTQSLTALFSPIIYDQTKKVYLPFFVGWITILYSIAANVLIVFTDRKFSKRYRK
jgi:MFS family permease